MFGRFRRWEGWVDGGWDVNWLGVRTRASYYDVFNVPDVRRFVSAPALPFDEEYFEWIDLLEALVGASDRFTMVELGAGWGRWIVNAAAAANQLGLSSYRLLAVEAEPQHYRWLQQHLTDNGVDLSRVATVNAAVAPEDGVGTFEVGNARGYYGQALLGVKTGLHARVASRFRRSLGRRRRGACGSWQESVSALSLRTLLTDLPVVDLIDSDIQGAEADVFESAFGVLTEKVRRVHIETHNRDVEYRLRSLFRRLGWRLLWDFPSTSDSATPYGVIHFEGGVQSWINERLEKCFRRPGLR